jgi:enediyne biosynthesis protein E4
MSPRRAVSFAACIVLPGLAVTLSSCQRPVPSPAAAPAVAAEDPPFAGGPVFADVTADSGLAFTYRNGEETDQFTILESLGGGVALIDYDRDGLLDIFLPGGGYFDGPDKKTIRGYPNRLFKNLGGMKFRDVTAEVGIPAEGLFYSHGAAVCDFDNDGWPDLLVTGYGRLALYRNDHGKFVDVTAEVGLADPGPLHWSTSAGWADLNGDGWPDLFVAHYVDWSFQNHPTCDDVDRKPDICAPNRFEPLPHALYFNQGGRRLELQKTAGIKPGPGLGVLLADLDGDGRVDVYVANDQRENFLYLNRGGGKLEDNATWAGVAGDEAGRPRGSMGVTAADCDGSGRPSIFVTNFDGEEHALYRNIGNGLFRYSSRAAGIAAISRRYVGFGTGFFDFDRDGEPDLFIASGHVLRRPASGRRQQDAILLHNRRRPGDPAGEVRFANVSEAGGDYFRVPHMGRGVAFGDLDNDGRIDLVVSHLNEPVAVLRNIFEPTTEWVGIALVGKAPRDPVGAVLTLTQGDRRQVRPIVGGGSYLSSSDPRVVFALEPQAGYRLAVRWPSGKEQTWDGAALGRRRYVVLHEGEDQPRAYPER